MKVLVVIQVLQLQVQERRQKTWPHVEKIKAVETVGNDQEIARQCIHMGRPGQKDHGSAHHGAAKPRVQKCRGETSDVEVIRHQRPRRHQDPQKILSQCSPGPGVSRSRGSRKKQRS